MSAVDTKMPISAHQSSTRLVRGQPQSADQAIDGDLETSSHTICAWNTDIWYMMKFHSVLCFDEVILTNSYLDYNAYRMQDLGVFVQDSHKETSMKCGAMKARGDSTIKGQTYKISCDGLCGDEIMLKVRHDRGDYSYMGCIHMSEVRVEFANSGKLGVLT